MRSTPAMRRVFHRLALEARLRRKVEALDTFLLALRIFQVDKDKPTRRSKETVQ